MVGRTVPLTAQDAAGIADKLAAQPYSVAVAGTMPGPPAGAAPGGDPPAAEACFELEIGGVD